MSDSELTKADVLDRLSPSLLGHLLDTIESCSSLGLVVGIAIAGHTFNLGSQTSSAYAAHDAVAFCKFAKKQELNQAIVSSNKVGQDPYVASVFDETDLETQNAIRWLKALRQFFEPLEQFLFASSIRIASNRWFHQNGMVHHEKRQDACWIFDFLLELNAFFHYLPIENWHVMDVTVDPKIAIGIVQRQIPGTPDMYAGTPTKHPTKIVSSYWPYGVIDLRKLLLIAELDAYFKAVLLTLRDWMERPPGTAAPNRKSVTPSALKPGPKRSDTELANDKLIFDLWTEFVKTMQKKGKRALRKNAAKIWLDKRDDVGFLTDGLEDTSDYTEIANRIELACKRHKTSATN